VSQDFGDAQAMEGPAEDIKEFSSTRQDDVLRNCLNAGYEALTMLDLIDRRIGSANEERIWQYGHSTLSIKATGKTKQRTPVAIYAHIHHDFSDPDSITGAIEQGLVNGAGIMTQDEFQRLLDLQNDKNVFVVDYGKLKKTIESKGDVFNINIALEHPQTIPFLGGEERAQRYLQKHAQVYGDKVIIWSSDDLADQPLARLLFIGGKYLPSLNGDYALDGHGRFVGIPLPKGTAAENKLEKEVEESIEQLVPGFTRRSVHILPPEEPIQLVEVTQPQKRKARVLPPMEEPVMLPPAEEKYPSLDQIIETSEKYVPNHRQPEWLAELSEGVDKNPLTLNQVIRRSRRYVPKYMHTQWFAALKKLYG